MYVFLMRVSTHSSDRIRFDMRWQNVCLWMVPADVTEVRARVRARARARVCVNVCMYASKI